MNRIVYDLQNSVGAYIMDEDQPVYERGPMKNYNKLWADIMRQSGLGFWTQFNDIESKSRLAREGRR
jgi:hypothetical protein